ncbi:hypothetical protein LTR56_017353 [Elasticomyces elasticus]|nr:hypothetical protein LTR56_017353 [Elasticomyces elasticus]KAK3664483.1 hypothetical protein LTR22_004617 [Elasticomyces elasticus]KAK4931796.1 hypothetical protein LTR49_001861 [Elasticomyces elasticus]KAK5762892.1 hypothetical protein LTS12_006879 [Elasticomyces elasticus]
MEAHLLDSAALARRQSTLSSSAYSTSSGSSPGLITDAAITPDSENDTDSTLVPKIEELDDVPLDEVEDTKTAISSSDVSLPTPNRRGRPRKGTLAEQKKTSHSRSKTGCGTCRRRKKKCDEAKPFCTGCLKNNVVCDGYIPRQPWRAGKSKAPTIKNSLPMLVEGVNGTVDQMFFHHFTTHVGKVLSLTDSHNPFLEIIVPMAMGHEGLMHSLLYLSGSCLMANESNPNTEWEERQEHHSSRAMRLLQEDLSEPAGADDNTVASIGDPSIAQTLLLCLQTVCAGDISGSYRFHLNAMKHMLTQHASAVPNEQLRRFILEFLLYDEHSSSITSLDNPLDQRSTDLMAEFKLPEFMIQPQAGVLLGVMDGLFGFISRIRSIRDLIRHRRAHSVGRWWDADVIDAAFAIDDALRAWKCVYPPDSPRYAPSLLYRQCTWLYLHRTIQLSVPSPTFKQAVDQGLEYLRMLPWDTDDGSTQSILLMPLFLLGCAAFEPEQRPEISEAFQRLQKWSSLGNIRYAREIVEQVWQMMDEGREEETWDWETIIARRGWDFLVV